MMYYLRACCVYLFAIIGMSVLLPVRCSIFKWYDNDFDKAMKKSFKFVKPFAKRIVSLAGVQIETKGKELIPKDQAVLYVGNHQSFFDIPILLASAESPMGFVAKSELKKVPLLGRWTEAIGSVFIDRDDERSALKMVLKLAERLKKHHHSMVIFPEGTRTLDGHVGNFKAGSLKIATRAEVPIVPFAIERSDRVMPRGKYGFQKEQVKVTFFDPIETNRKTDTVALASYCQALTSAVVDKKDQKQSKNGGNENDAKENC